MTTTIRKTPITSTQTAIYNKIAYCKRVYKVIFTKDDIETLQGDYKVASRFLRDCEYMREKHPKYYEQAINSNL